MELRSGTPTGGGRHDDAQGSPPAPGGRPGAVPTGPHGTVQWRVDSGRTMLKLVAAVLFALAGVFFGADPPRLALALGVAAGFAAFALRDLLVPVRLAADYDGVTVVTGLAHRRRLAWSQIERVRVDVRPRLGTRSELLEIDTGESLHLFSTHELGAPVSEVADTLTRLRTG
ncbi:MAG TPA: PH domain-containing protein [Micromonosporaceae bacterium]|nr:PH domain-containing protein [Micromonosporaceae bacterium]